MKVLFVCTGNIDRSVTAQEIFNGVNGIEAKSAGTSNDAPTKLSKKLIRWADKIFCMEPKHERMILKLDPESRRKIKILNIPDIYSHGEPELKRLLKEKLQTLSGLGM